MASPAAALAVYAVGRRGAQIAARIRAQLGGDAFAPERFLGPSLPGVRPLDEAGIKSALAEGFRRYREIVIVLPVGAAVRLLSPLLDDKHADPAVVAVDEAGRYAVALLSAHVGGGNDLARRVAAVIGAEPVITTASEAVGTLALDLLGRDWGWTIEPGSALTRATAAVIDGEPVGVFQDAGEEDWWQTAPANLVRYARLEDLLAAPVAARLVITDRTIADLPSDTVVFRPRSLVVGIGCSRGTTAEDLDALLERGLAMAGLARASIRCFATIDVKRDEAGITTLAERIGCPVDYFDAEQLRQAGTPSGPSEAVERAVGAPGVCEPAALLAAGARELILPKLQSERATVAIARYQQPGATGHLAIVGIGPGDPAALTDQARRALVEAEAIVGYQGYIDQVRPWLGEKRYHASPIGNEIDRCRLAIALSRQGQRIALISSGDAGIYAMAGLVFELLAQEGALAEANAIEVIPGITAAQAAAAILGAPLMSDFVVISLSDLMTPWEVIERRLEAAGLGDLVVALYNPASMRRRRQLETAVEMLLRYRGPATPVGVVRNATRPGQQVILTELGQLLDQPVDMFSLVLIGNSATIRVGDRLVTRRGYLPGESFSSRRGESGASSEGAQRA